MIEHSTHLPLHAANADVHCEEIEPLLARRPLGLATLMRYCQQRRVRGIAALLMEGDVATFCESLAASGRTFVLGLAHVPAARLVVSHWTPFYDALAVEDDATSRALAAVGQPLAWQPDYEYEEAYVYIRLLMALASDDTTRADEASPEALLARLSDLAGDLPDPSYVLCEALYYGDDASFDTAFAAWTEYRADKMMRLSASGALLPEVVATEGFFNVEGMALLRLAHRRGLAPRGDYRCVPASFVPLQPAARDAARPPSTLN